MHNSNFDFFELIVSEIDEQCGTGRTDESPHLGILDEEAELLVKYWAAESVEPYYFAFLHQVYGGEWRRRSLAYSRIDKISELVGDDRVQEWYYEGIEAFGARQNPTLWA